MNNQEAIALLRNLEDSLDSYCELNEDGKKAFHMAIESLELFGNSEQLPSAQPQRMRGHWIIKDNPGTGWYRVTCSECGEDVTSNVPVIGYFPNAKVLWDFCPYCGAQMDGGEQE